MSDFAVRGGATPTPHGASVPLADNASSALAMESAAGATEIDSTEQAGKASATGTTGAATSANSALYTPSGAPKIDGVAINFSAEDMAAALMTLQSKTQDAQLRTAKEGLEVAKKKRQDQHEKVMNKLNEWIKNSEKAESKSKLGKIFGWVSKVASFVASAVAVAALTVGTGLTAGAASPLLALAIVGLVGSTMSLASSISQECGGPPIQISAFTDWACSKVLTACGVPKDVAASIAKVAGSALVVGLAPGALLLEPQLMGNLAAGIAELGGLDASKVAILSMAITMATSVAITLFTLSASTATSGAANAASSAAGAASGAAAGAASGTAGAASGVASAASSATNATTNLIQRTMNFAIESVKAITKSNAKMFEAGVQVINGTASVTSGSLGIEASVHNHRADIAQADRQKFSAIMVKLQAQMEEEQEQIKKLVQELQEGFTNVSQMIAAAGDSRSQIASNIGRRVMA